MQLAPLIPGAGCVFVRGNVLTRLAKLDAGEYGALVLAMAGLKRLGLEGRANRIFSTDEMLPAAGQGILAVAAREGGDSARLAEAINDPALRRRALAERTFTCVLDGGCGLPVAAFAREEDGELILEGRFRYENEDLVSRGVLRGGPAKPEDLGRRLAFRLIAETARRNNRLGSVCLAGAGPGDPGLLTARSAAALASADVVVFDKLVGPGVLAAIPPRAEKIYAGKESGHHSLPQERINEVLVKKVAAGLRVLRLKGGDPLLFGRGSEEALCLMDAGITCEVLFGVSSALAAPGSAGVPLTHRGVSSRLHIIAAHGEGSRTIDFSMLARQCAAGDTLVFLMGAARLKRLCASLSGAGLPGDTPAAVVSNGTTAKQRRAASTLAGLADRAAEAGIEAPAVIVLGDVCRLDGSFSFRAEKPLTGVRVAVTRPRGGVNRLAALLDAAGAEVIALPVIRIAPRAEAPLLQELFAKMPLAKTWFAFTSVHGVEAFFEKLAEYRVDIRSLAACKFAAVGNTTCASLAARGVIADLKSEVFTGAALGAALAKTAAKDERVILPRSSIGGREILNALDAAGLERLDIPLYDTVPETGYENPAFRARLVEGLDYAAFTSPSAAEGFVGIFGSTDIPALCIGEATAAPARALGMNVIVPETASLEGMVEALVALRQKEGR
jgi:uroporphyrinogen III methyltransferase/synthase